MQNKRLTGSVFSRISYIQPTNQNKAIIQNQPINTQSATGWVVNFIYFFKNNNKNQAANTPVYSRMNAQAQRLHE